MFHRRLLLLMVVCLGAFAGLGAQLTNLTAIQGEGLLRAAESKLVRQRWMPTVRGRILDRHGRVLAQDRPSFSAKVKFDILSGPEGRSRWARSEAVGAARRRNQPAWDKLDDAGRAALIGRYQAIYEAHLESMWDTLAKETGVDRAEIDARREAVVEDVQRRKRSYVARQVTKEYRALLEQRWEAPPEGSEAAAVRRAEIDARVASVGERVRAGRSAAEAPDLQRLGPGEDPEFLARAASRFSAERIGEEGRPGAFKRGEPAQDGPDAHTLVARLSDAQGFALLRLSEEEVGLDVSGADLVGAQAAGDRPAVEQVELLPGLVIADARDRAYPFDRYDVSLDRSWYPGPLRSETAAEVTVEGVACHLIGRLRHEVHETDSVRRSERIRGDPEFAARVLTEGGVDRGRYVDGDSVGESGIEGSWEDELRGLRGLSTLHIDTGESSQQVPQNGQDIRLTIDAVLQARVQAVMSPAAGLAVVQRWQGHQGGSPNEGPMPEGTALHGAAVVLDVRTGEVLAMVSTPAYSTTDLRERPAWVFLNDLDYPYLNKAIARPYPPGSIAKAVTLCGAMALGHYALGERIACTGHFYPDKPGVLRCWVYRPQYGNTTHSIRLGHDPDAAEAMMVSCNIFYFSLGKRLGPEGITDTYQRFGVGEGWGLGVGMEYAGAIGATPALGQGLSIDDAVQMGIGQGPISWTPLHAADAFATLARGGVRIQPSVIDPKGREAPAVETGVPAAAIDEALEGLRRSVASYDGTGNHLIIDEHPEPIFNVPGVDVWGKTGTAQTQPTRGDPDGKDGPEPEQVRTGDHSWFVVLAGPEGGRPLYSIAVMMEHAGSGGKVSGPIANQIIHALAAEGYLPGGPGRAGLAHGP
jgi:cell division protein FtsI/penicillin-binding protein 2